MKKKIILPVLGLLLTVVLAGCAINKKDIRGAGNGSFGGGQPEGQLPSGPRRPDFGQPERDPDARGIVKSITGSEVTILKVEGGFGRRSSSTPSGAASSTEERKDNPSISLAGAAQGRPGGMGPGMGRPGEQEQGSGDRTSMLETLKQMSTGEEVVTVPVGIRMLKASDSDNGRREMVEASLSDISADKSLMIWYDSSVTDKKVAEFVLIN